MEMTMHFSDDVSPSQLYICCDIVEDSYVRNTTLPILRAQDVTAEQLFVHNTYTHPIYLKISKQDIPDIRIYVRTIGCRPDNLTLNTLTASCVCANKKPWLR